MLRALVLLLAVSQPTVPGDVEVPNDATPRGAIRAFFDERSKGNDEEAARFLDLSAIPEAERGEAGPALARDLGVVLNRTLWVDLDTLSDRPEGAADDGLPADKDRLGTIPTKGGPQELQLKRVAGPDGTRVWRFAPSTVRRIPDLYAELGYPPLVDRLPRALVERRFLSAELWQWIGLLLLAIAAWSVAFVVTWAVARIVSVFARRTHTTLDDRILAALRRPVRLTITLYLFLGNTYWLGLAVPVQSFLNRATRGLTVLLVTWMFLRVADLVAASAQERMLREDRRSALSMVHLGRRAAKIAIIALGFLGLLQNLGFNVTGIVAGLGIGGLAVALAAQKTLENVFGGIVLTADRPIRVGDFCRFGDKQGTVEEVGLRSTRIRTLDRTVVSVPNAELASVQIENFAARDRFRIFATLGVRYETRPEQLTRLVGSIRSLLEKHPRIAKEPLRVRFVGFGPSSLDIEVFAYVETSDVEEFYAIREEIWLSILRVVEEAGAGFAFPSRTLYIGRDAGVARERRIP